MSKFKEGDIVIPKDGNFKGVKCRVNSVDINNSYAVESLLPNENRGHNCCGAFDTCRGWYYSQDLLDLAEEAEETEPVEDTVTIRFLTEQEFKHRGQWAYSAVCPS